MKRNSMQEWMSDVIMAIGAGVLYAIALKYFVLPTKVILTGAAKAIAFRNRGSTGDEDILGAYCAMKYLKPVGSIAVIAAVGSTTFGLIMDYLKTGQFETAVNTLMYTCIYIFASAETLTTTFDHRTCTVQEGIGGFSGESFRMVRTIIAHDELDKLMDAVEQADPHCFYYHHDIEGVSNRYYIAPID